MRLYGCLYLMGELLSLNKKGGGDIKSKHNGMAILTLPITVPLAIIFAKGSLSKPIKSLFNAETTAFILILMVTGLYLYPLASGFGIHFKWESKQKHKSVEIWIDNRKNEKKQP
ncbi:hypothetical protein A9986_14215 [Solibacillus silvestris]|nr:hypothetical protein [Solibacillus silvestris]OBW54773.1 hypothetical protein A9986_14215 [Solibacillus silvestris]